MISRSRHDIQVRICDNNIRNYCTFVRHALYIYVLSYNDVVKRGKRKKFYLHENKKQSKK